MTSGTNGRDQGLGAPRASSGTTVGEFGEFALIDAFVRPNALGPAISLGPGDDAAVHLVNGSAVTSTDMLCEGVHFRTDWSSAQQIGRKAVAENVADLEAMGAEPVALLVALGLPSDTEVEWVRHFAEGLYEEAERASISVVGGDTTRASSIVISVTVSGQTGRIPPVRRDGARPGQIVAIAGRLGWAAAGLATLQRGFRSPRAVVQAQQVPEVPYGAGRTAALAGAGAMIDVSDGLVADLGHIAKASGVGIDLLSARLPIDEPLRVVGQATGTDPLQFVLTGGEDHALAATFDDGFVPPGWTIIGAVAEHCDEPGVRVDGVLMDRGGWDHFPKK